VNTTIEKIERLNLALLAAGTLLVWIMGWLDVPSFLLGGGIMQLNFWLLKKIVRALLTWPAEQPEKKGKKRTVMLFVGKSLLFLLLLSGLFVRYPVQPFSFLCGVSLLLVTCMIVTLSELLTGTQAQDTSL
jgi:hypothetical protein